MGNICCESPRDNFKEEIINSISIEDIITYLKEKIKNATIEQNDLLTYLNDNNLKPSTINIDGFKEKDLKKRIPYLDEIKNCINKVIDLLERYPNTDLMEIKRRICDFYEMYTWLYDNDKRYEIWFLNFKNFIEKDFKKLSKNQLRKTMPIKKSLFLGKNEMKEKSKEV